MLSQFVFVLKIKIKWSLWPFPLHEISVLIETILGHLRYLLTDVPPQPNSPPDCVFNTSLHKSFLLYSKKKNSQINSKTMDPLTTLFCSKK